MIGWGDRGDRLPPQMQWGRWVQQQSDYSVLGALAAATIRNHVFTNPGRRYVSAKEAVWDAGLPGLRASSCAAVADGKTPSPAPPKVSSSALSSNSPTMRGPQACWSNQWSRCRGRSAPWAAAPARASGREIRARQCHQRGGPYQATDVPSAWLWTRRFGWRAPDGRPAPRPADAAPVRPAGPHSPSWHTRRRSGRRAPAAAGARPPASAGRPRSPPPGAGRGRGRIAHLVRERLPELEDLLRLRGDPPASVSAMPRPTGLQQFAAERAPARAPAR